MTKTNRIKESHMTDRITELEAKVEDLREDVSATYHPTDYSEAEFQRRLTDVIAAAEALGRAKAEAGDIRLLGLHTHITIRYEVDQYRAELLNENERVLGEAVGDTPFAALRALDPEGK